MEKGTVGAEEATEGGAESVGGRCGAVAVVVVVFVVAVVAVVVVVVVDDVSVDVGLDGSVPSSVSSILMFQNKSKTDNHFLCRVYVGTNPPFLLL